VEDTVTMTDVRAAGLGFCLGRGDEITVINALISFCFSVDEYIAIAKEKHGYNMEQVINL